MEDPDLAETVDMELFCFDKLKLQIKTAAS